MVGVIRRRDIFSHPLVTIQCFGWPVFLRALLAGRGQTFLSVLVETRALRPPTIEVPELLGHCIALELSAQRIYKSLADRYPDNDEVRVFFETLASQEQDHADLLWLCREAAGREGWREERFRPWRDAIPRLERQMAAEEASLGKLVDLADALRLVIRVEGSEINQLFDSVVAATDSEFVRKLEAFHIAETDHISYITQQIPEFEPTLASECQELNPTA